VPQVPALHKGARLVLQVTHAAPPVPHALALVAVTQDVPLQHPFGQVAALHAGRSGLHTPLLQIIVLQQFLLLRQAFPRWTQRQRRFFELHTPVQHCVSFVQRLAAAEPSPQGPSRCGRRSPRAAGRLPAALPGSSAPPSRTPSAPASPARRVVPACSARSAASNWC
jgi:hypothetical protein